MVVRAGLVEYLAEVSVTNHDRIRAKKVEQLRGYMEARTAQRKTALSAGEGEGVAYGLWRNLGQDAVIMRFERSRKGGVNFAVCNGTEEAGQGHCGPGDAPLGKGETLAAETKKFMNRRVSPALRDYQAGLKKPVRLVVFASKCFVDGAEMWLRALKFPVQGAVLQTCFKQESEWEAIESEGLEARELATSLQMGWPQDGIPQRVRIPMAVVTKPILALFDTSGTAYPETVQSFKTATGSKLPSSVGATIILAVGAIFRLWRRAARIRRNRARRLQ